MIRSSLIPLVVLSLGCASVQAARTADARESLTIVNESYSPGAIYVDGYRAGRVEGFAETRVRYHVVSAATPVVVTVRFTDGGHLSLDVLPGETGRLVIQPNQRALTIMPGRVVRQRT
jgi:hypothetical protein